MNAPTPELLTVESNGQGQYSISNEQTRSIDNWKNTYIRFGGYFGNYKPELFAAAPDLLAACKLFMTYHDGESKYDVASMLAYADAEQAIRAAVAKTTGGTP